MITTADAIEVMTIVAACHRRTAPRMDDDEATIAVATVWAELFNEYRLQQQDLIKAVKRRAATNPDAPEPAEIITAAREMQRLRDAATGPTPEYEARCEAKAVDAAELAALRAHRSATPIAENPTRLAALVAGLADRKALDHA